MSTDQMTGNYPYRETAVDFNTTLTSPEVTAPVDEIARPTNSLVFRLWKEGTDFLVACVLLVALSPLLALITLIIRLDSRGGALYRREQVGKDGHIFTAFKFRTMQADNDDTTYKNYITRYVLENAPYTRDATGNGIYKVVDDPRVTRFGAWLRRTNLDELPQLFNVIRGEMSIIGPRPDIPYAVGMYQPWQLKRLAVKPGITGLWQVSGRKELPFEDMVRLDLDYIRRQSLFLDIKIFFLTLVTILRRDGS